MIDGVANYTDLVNILSGGYEQTKNRFLIFYIIETLPVHYKNISEFSLFSFFFFMRAQEISKKEFFDNILGTSLLIDNPSKAVLKMDFF